MTRPDADTARLIDEEAEHAEVTRENPYPPGVVDERGNRSRSSVYSVRLSEDEVAEVQQLAREAGLPASTLVRSWITQRIADRRSTHASVDPAVREAIRSEVQAALTDVLASAGLESKRTA